MMRALFLEFPADLNTYSIEHQYMLGSNLLVAPVLVESGTVTFHVPEDPNGGEWVSWFDHSKKYAGGKWYTETFGISELPLLVRPGTVTLIKRCLKKTDDVSEEGLELLVCGRLDGEIVLELADVEKTHEVKRKITVKADGDKVQAEDAGLKVMISYM